MYPSLKERECVFYYRTYHITRTNVISYLDVFLRAYALCNASGIIILWEVQIVTTYMKVNNDP